MSVSVWLFWDRVENERREGMFHLYNIFLMTVVICFYNLFHFVFCTVYINLSVTFFVLDTQGDGLA